MRLPAHVPAAVLALAGLLHAAGAAAAEPAAPAPGFNLFDAFMEACINNEYDAEAAAKKLEARGAKRRPGQKRGDILSLDWSTRGPRLMISYNTGMCVASTDAADRDVSLRAFMGSRPPTDATRLPRAQSGVPEDFDYLAGFQLRATNAEGRTNVMDIFAYQDDAPKPVLSMMVVIKPAARDQPPPAAEVPKLPLATAADVAAVFEEACVRTRADIGGVVDVAQAQRAVWFGDENPRMLRYGLGDTQGAVVLMTMRGYCAVMLDRMTTAELQPALEAVLGRLEGVTDVPVDERPKAEGITFSVARQGTLPGDAEKALLRAFLLGREGAGGRLMHMLILERVAERANP